MEKKFENAESFLVTVTDDHFSAVQNRNKRIIERNNKKIEKAKETKTMFDSLSKEQIIVLDKMVECFDYCDEEQMDLDDLGIKWKSQYKKMKKDIETCMLRHKNPIELFENDLLTAI